MATNPSDVLKLGRDNDAKFFDIRFSDLPGLMQHFTVPFDEVGEEVFDEGFGFDGSSIRGFQEIQESDMILVPDPATAVMDPFTRYPTVITHAYVKDPLTGEFYSRDPRYVAKKGHRLLRSRSGVLHL
jgi:glutamine synthetase